MCAVVTWPWVPAADTQHRRIDILLEDLHVALPLHAQLLEWLLPVRPKAYTAIADQVVAQIEAKRKGN
jgi:hypothetical protein